MTYRHHTDCRHAHHTKGQYAYNSYSTTWYSKSQKDISEGEQTHVIQILEEETTSDIQKQNIWNEHVDAY